jgi:hypothetical protein
MITISNPVNDENGNPRFLNTFPNGVMPLMELIKSAEDVSRYDGFLLIPKVEKRLNPFEYTLQGTPIPKEAYQNKIDWHANRVLAKVSYVVHTDAIKNIIVPTLTEKQKKFVYAEEADVLNVALFGITAKEWRIMNPELAKSGNIRDYTDILHLIILNNLECYNSELIKQGISQRERLSILNNTAINQMDLLCNKVYKLNNH